MTDLQHHQRAAFIREEPLLWFVLLYAVAFLSCAVANEVLLICGATGLPPSPRYLIPLALTLTSWLGLRSWSRRVIAGAPQPPVE